MADPFAAEVKPSEDGLEIRWRSTANLGKSWLPVDVYRAHGRWTHRLRFTVELPREDAQRVRGFAVLAVTKDGKTLPAQWATAGLEASGERVLAHLMVVFPWDLKERALWKGRAFEARFLLSYRKSR